MELSALIQQAQAGDKKAREQAISDNVGLVWSIVRRFLGRGQEMEDLFQIGIIGLMKAVDKFDVSYEVKFSTYAVPLISGEIKRFLRDNNSLIKLSRSVKENGWKIRQIREQLAVTLGRDATMEELADATGLSTEDIMLAIEANCEVESIYRTVYQGEGNEIYLVDRIPQKQDEAERLIDRMTIHQLLDLLEEDEKKLMKYRYFEEKTQTEAARLLGISQVQVSRLEKKILLKMRRNMFT